MEEEHLQLGDCKYEIMHIKPLSTVPGILKLLSIFNSKVIKTQLYSFKSKQKMCTPKAGITTSFSRDDVKLPGAKVKNKKFKKVKRESQKFQRRRGESHREKQETRSWSLPSQFGLRQLISLLFLLTPFPSCSYQWSSCNHEPSGEGASWLVSGPGTPWLLAVPPSSPCTLQLGSPGWRKKPKLTPARQLTLEQASLLLSPPYREAGT